MYVYESQKLILCVFLNHISALFFRKVLLGPKLTDGIEWPAAPPGPGNLLVTHLPSVGKMGLYQHSWLLRS